MNFFDTTALILSMFLANGYTCDTINNGEEVDSGNFAVIYECYNPNNQRHITATYYLNGDFDIIQGEQA